MKLKFGPTLLLMTVLSSGISAQEVQTKKFTSERGSSIDGVTVPVDFVDAQWISTEAPKPDGESVRSHLMDLKQQQRALHPVRTNHSAPQKTLTDSLKITDGKFLTQKLITGLEIPIYGGIPNDNSLAVSNGGIVLLAFNSHISGYDLNTGENLYDDGRYALGLIGRDFDGPSNNFYDPKVQYDPVNDRFVLAFLRGNAPNTSGIILAFSKTNDPRDGWNVYALPGNPLNNDRWTDFPVIMLTDSELIFTANFIIPGQPWQTGFDGSMIWQVGLQEGYNGDTAVDARLWYDIKFNGRFTRNLHAVQHGDSPDRADVFLLSNRNFSLQNDTIFLLHLTGQRDDANTSLEVDALKSSQDYGVPPFGRQSDTDTNNASSGFDTNDGRVLGAFFVNDHIQFVSNTIDFSSGRSAIYHGMIEDPYADDPMVSGQIIGHNRLDFGYPNVAWTGTQPCERQAIIGFNHSSPNDPAGCSAIFYSDNGEYSPVTYITKGESHVNRHAGNYERWGDYFGLQRVYNNPGEVWSSGYYGHPGANNGIYSARIYSPDTLHLQVEVNAEEGNALCNASVTINAINGEEPYQFTFNGESSLSNSATGFCAGDTVEVSITDASQCSKSSTVVIPLTNPSMKSTAYPVPASENLITRVKLPSSGEVSILLSDLNGREIVVLTKRYSSKGSYELNMDVSNVATGTYVLKIFLNNEELSTEKVLIE